MEYGSVESVKTRSGVDFEDLNVDDAVDLDEFIENLLALASGYIERYVQRTFDSTTTTEIKTGNNSMTLMLDNFPVISVDSVIVDGETLDGADYRIKPIAGYGDNNGGILERLDGDDFRKGNHNVTVTYTWGYQTPPAAVTDIAEEIASELLLTAVNNFKTGGLESMSIEGFQTKFDNRRPLTESQRQRLDSFKKAVFA